MATIYNFEIAGRLKRALQKQKRTQVAIARELGLSQAYISSILSGTMPANPMTMVRIAQAVGEDAAAILRDFARAHGKSINDLVAQFGPLLEETSSVAGVTTGQERRHTA